MLMPLLKWWPLKVFRVDYTLKEHQKKTQFTQVNTEKMMHKTFSLTPKVRKCVILIYYLKQSRRLLHLHLPLHQLGLQWNTLSTVFIVLQWLQRHSDTSSKSKFIVKLPDQHRYWHTTITEWRTLIHDITCSRVGRPSFNYVTRRRHTLRRVWKFIYLVCSLQRLCYITVSVRFLHS